MRWNHSVRGLLSPAAFIGLAEEVGLISDIAALGRSLGMTTTAEGIETLDQLELVRAQGCTDLQVYYFSKPRPKADIEEMLLGGRHQMRRASAS